MTHVLVRQAILGLAPSAGGGDQAHLSQMSQVLGHQRLAGTRGIGELMYAKRPRNEGTKDAQAHGVGEGLEEVRGRLELLILCHILILADTYRLARVLPRVPASREPAPGGEHDEGPEREEHDRRPGRHIEVEGSDEAEDGADHADHEPDRRG